MFSFVALIAPLRCSAVSASVFDAMEHLSSTPCSIFLPDAFLRLFALAQGQAQNTELRNLGGLLSLNALTQDHGLRAETFVLVPEHGGLEHHHVDDDHGHCDEDVDLALWTAEERTKYKPAEMSSSIYKNRTDEFLLPRTKHGHQDR
ncbi:hypothetical protein C8J56DRAFT_879443 [Mycena floridula]|nr:hypothetical protein C8J56DRAFT_879443 [Mycena floridula]